MIKHALNGRWPQGTGQWGSTRIVIVSADERRRIGLMNEWPKDAALVATPLDVILYLQDNQNLITTVVLAGTGGSAADSELAAFLHEAYPWLEIIVRGGSEKESEKPRLDAHDQSELTDVAV